MTARRSRGDGGLTQRHDHASCPPAVKGKRPEHKCRGRWQGSVPIEVGSTRRKYVYGATKKEAGDRLREAVQQRDAGTLSTSSITVEAWLTHWLDHIAEVRPQTHRGYASKIRVYLIPHLGRHRLSALRPEHVRLMYRSMRDAGLAEATLRQTHAVLSRALKVALQEGKLTRNPLDSVKPPSTKTKRRAQLSEAEARAVLASTDDARWWLAVFYGMRQGEVLGLRWCDVDLINGYLEVVQTLQKDKDGAVMFGPPKSDAGERVVPLVPVMLARLKVAHAGAGSPPPDSTELVFPRLDGGPRDAKADWTEWRHLLLSVNAPPVALHSARQTAASLLEAAGVAPRLVGQILGHSNVRQTENYQHAEVERMAAALNAGASLLDLAALNPTPILGETDERDD